MHRVLRPAGEVVAAETKDSLLSVLPRKIAGGGEHFSSEHKNLTRRNLEAMFEPYFTIDHVAYFGYIAYPLLGFPDIVNVFRFVPFKSAVSAVLMGIDNVIARLPILRPQSWGILIKCTVRGKPAGAQ